jgi:hypothetical protein
VTPAGPVLIDGVSVDDLCLTFTLPGEPLAPLTYPKLTFQLARHFGSAAVVFQSGCRSSGLQGLLVFACPVLCCSTL